MSFRQLLFTLPSIKANFICKVATKTMSSGLKNTEVPEGFEEIKEGKASMLYNKNETVFYNKVQVLNRDLSIQVIRLFADTIEKERTDRRAKKRERNASESVDTQTPQSINVEHGNTEGITVLDALAATGLRSVRYLKEIPGVKHVTINDLDASATQQAMNNIQRNGVPIEKVSVSNMDACLLMYQHREPLLQYDVIDLDPYGTAAPFLDPAVQAVADGGLLCVTCTDMPVLSGNYPETCFAKYGCMPLKGRYTHEMSLRILLHAIDTAANKYKRHIEPWIAISVDFYVRVFVRIFQSPAEVKRSCLKRSYVVQSSQCPSFYIQPMGMMHKQAFTGAVNTVPMICPETGGRMKIGGPFWSAPIHKQDVVDELLLRVEALEENRSVKTGKDNNEVEDSKPNANEDKDDKSVSVPATIVRLKGLLTSVSEELKDVPLYYMLPDLASTLHVSSPIMRDVQAALINAGYRVSQSHREPNAVKTDAPAEVVWDIMRCWCAKYAPEVLTKKYSPSCTAILTKTPKLVADFTIPEILLQPKKKATRFPPNPEINWGPKRRAGRLVKEQSAVAAVTITANTTETDQMEIQDSLKIESHDIDQDEELMEPVDKKSRDDDVERQL